MSPPHGDGAATRAPSLFQTLQAHDPQALIDFCVEALGFIVTARTVEDDVVQHAELRWRHGAGGLMLGPHRPGHAWSRDPGTCGTYLVTPELDDVYARARHHEAEVVRPLADTDYGSREFAVRDPEGNLWFVGTYPGEPLPTDSP